MGKEWNDGTFSWVSTPHIFNPAVGLTNWSFSMPVATWTVGGPYTIYAKAKDVSNNFQISTITFHLNISTNAASDTVPPTAHVIHPLYGTTHAPDALGLIQGTAADNIAIDRTQINIRNLNTGNYFGGTLFNSTSTVWFQMANPTNWVFSGISSTAWTNTHVYRLTVDPEDTNGNIGTAFSTFSINTALSGDSIPPIVSISTPVNGGIYAPAQLQFTGNASDNVGLADVTYRIKRNSNGLYYDGVGFTLATPLDIPTLGLSLWSFNIPPVAFSDGAYTLTVNATDVSTNTAGQTITFSVSGSAGSADVTAPTAEILFPVNSAIYNDPAQLTVLSGTANDDTNLIEIAGVLHERR